MKTSISSVLVIVLALSLLPQSVYARKLYKTVDESGKTSFTDQIPPEDAKYHRETLNKQGRVVDVTEKEKPKEEQERERQLQALRKKQEKIIEQQRSHDEALLRTYHSKAEMENELKTKLQSIEAQKRLLEGEVAQHTERLDVTQKKAATYERNAQTIPKSILEDIKSIQAEVEKAKHNIQDNLALQEKVKEEYQTNIRRFLLLTQTSETAPSNNNANKVSSIEEADALGLFRCENDYQCNKAWQIAKLFVDSYSITPADINTDNLIMHALPNTDSEYSLSIAKLSGRHDEILLFLDIHCRESSLGQELCASKKIQELRATFRSYVNERLSKSN